jgi:uncharacterized protein involved in outer membrane biogenesis
MKKNIFIIIIALFIAGIALFFVAKNTGKMIKEKIESSLGKNITIENISLSWNGVDLSGVTVIAAEEVVLKADRIGLKVDFFGFLKKGYALSRLILEKPYLVLRIDKNGEFVHPFSTEQENKKSNQSNQGEATSISIGSLVIHDGEIHFVDERRPVQMNSIDVKKLNLRVEDFAYPKNDMKSAIDCTAQLEGKIISGRYTLQGNVNLKTLAMDLKGSGEKVVLLDFQGKGPTAKVESFQFSVTSSGTQQYVFPKIVLHQPYLRVDVDNQGKYVNPFDLIEPIAPRISGSTSSLSVHAVQAEKPAEVKSTYLIENLQISDGIIDYYNHKVSPSGHLTHLTAVQFSMDNIALPKSDKLSHYSFSAMTAGGTIASKGSTVLASKDTNAVLTIKNLDVTQFRPYFQKKGDALVTRGILNLDLDLVIKSKIINAPGKMVLKNLAFESSGGLGGKVLGFPRAAVVSLLKSSNDEIVVNFTIQGNIDDPQFSIRDSLTKKFITGLADKLGAPITGIGSVVIDAGKEGVKQVGKGVSGIGTGLKKLFGK